MKTCKQCSLCIGNILCDSEVYPNSGRCVVFIQLLEEKFTSRKQKNKVSVASRAHNTTKPKIRPTVPRCLKVGDCVDTGNADCVGCDYFSA